MKSLACTFGGIGLATLAPLGASAADLDDYGYDAPIAIEEHAPAIVRERVIVRDYYIAPPPPVVVERYPRPYPYHAGFDGWERDYYRDRPEW